MNDKKILIINNGIAGGGIERASVSLANHFSELGYSVTILALYQSKPFFKLHVNLNFIEPKFKRTKFNKIFYVFKMMLFIRKNIKKLQPDTILSYSEWTNPFVVLATRKISIPLFLSDRMHPLAKLPVVSEWLRRLLYEKATGIIAQTSFAKKTLATKTKSKNIKVIPNPVNVIEKVNCISKNIIVSVGRLSKEKGHKYLIEAFAEIIDNSWELSVIGDGNEREYLENLCIQLGIQNRVKFHGHLNDFSLQLSEAQIFVLPSLTEGFPNALIEAMSVPLACISSNYIGAPNEIIKDGINGLFVEPANIDNLVSTLNQLIENPDLRNSMAVEAYKIRETLAFNKIAQQYLNFIFQENE